MEDGHRHFSREKKILIKTYRNISENKLRIWLFKSLMSENLATRDIYTFAKNQSELRTTIKVLDKRSMTNAMKMKLKDIKLALSENSYNKKHQEMNMIKKYGLEALKECKTAKEEIITLECRKKIEYQTKINHYKHCQKEQNELKRYRPHMKKIKPTIVPKFLSEFVGLSIFGFSNDIPKPSPPIGPCICEKTIKLSKDELSVLNKDPKFSVCKPVSKISFLTEVERMSSKHRYRRNIKRKKMKENKLSDHLISAA